MEDDEEASDDGDSGEGDYADMEVDDDDDREDDPAAAAADLEISISFQPQEGGNAVQETHRIGGDGGVNFDDEASRLVSAAASATARSSNGVRDMRPPTRRLSEEGRSRHRHFHQHGRAYESTFDQAAIDNDEAMSGYDSALDMFDARDHEDLVQAASARDGDNDGNGEWITINHGDDDEEGDNDDDSHDDHEEVYHQVLQHGRGTGGGNRNRQQRGIPDYMESLFAQSGGPAMGGGMMSSGAVRVAGDDLMGFLGTLPIPSFIRDSLASGAGGMRHVVAHLPMNGNDAEHEDGVMLRFGGGENVPGGVRDALQTLMRPRGQNRPVTREGTTSNAAPSLHPLLGNGGVRAQSGSGRPRSNSAIEAIMSSLSGRGVGGYRPDGLTSAQAQEMKSITTQRRRLLGSLISERRWGTDVGDRDVSVARLNAIGQSVVNYYKAASASTRLSGEI